MGLIRRKASQHGEAGAPPRVLSSESRLVVAWTGRFQREIRTLMKQGSGVAPRDLGGRRRFGCHWDSEALAWLTVSLVREPANPFDPCAVAVRGPSDEKVGYLPRRTASALQQVVAGPYGSERQGVVCTAYVTEDPGIDGRPLLGLVLCLSSARRLVLEAYRVQAREPRLQCRCHDWLSGPAGPGWRHG